jgi:hypothetical protein
MAISIPADSKKFKAGMKPLYLGMLGMTLRIEAACRGPHNYESLPPNAWLAGDREARLPWFKKRLLMRAGVG